MAVRKRRIPRTINAFMARTNFGKVLRQVEDGETFVVTRQGTPKAVVLGMKAYEDLLEVAAEEKDEELRKALKESAAQIRGGEVSSLAALRAIYKRR